MKFHLLFVLLLCVIWLNGEVVEGAKAHVATLAAVSSWGPNATNSMLSMVRFAAYWLNNQTEFARDVHIDIVADNCGPGSGNPSVCLKKASKIAIDYEGNLTGFVTGAYSNDQRILQFVANAYDLPQVVGIASGNILSHKEEYPTLLRTMIPDAVGNLLAIRWMVENGWKHAAVPLDSGDFGSGTREALQIYADRYNVSLEFFNCPLGGNDYTVQANLIKNAGYRVIMVMLQPRETYVWMDAANKTGLVGRDYAYILSVSGILAIAPIAIPNYQSTVPREMNLTALRPLFDGAVGFASHGATGEFYAKLKKVWDQPDMQYMFPSSRVGSTYSWYLFDAVLSFGIAIQEMLDKGVAFQNATKKALYNYMANDLKFYGVTGAVKFDPTTGDRNGLVDMIHTTPTGSNFARLYDPETDSYTVLRNITFFGNRTDSPLDMPCQCVHGRCRKSPTDCECDDGVIGDLCEISVVYRGYNEGLSAGLGALVGACVCLALFAGFVLAFKWNNFAGHGPFYCSIIIFGVVISYISAFSLLPKPTDQLCMAFPWLLGMAFNLVYGCLFIKTWALYSAFRAAAKLERARLTPYYILKVLTAFLLVEAVLLIVWTIVEPPKAKYRQMLDDSYQLVCHSENNTFWIIFVAYKGVWLIVGAVMSFLTRNVAKEYNESKSIAYAIYNDMALLIIAIPLALTLSEVPSGSLIIEVAVIVLAFTFTLFILFFPIWYNIFYQHIDPVAMTNPSARSSQSKSLSSSKSSHSSEVTTSKTVEIYTA